MEISLIRHSQLAGSRSRLFIYLPFPDYFRQSSFTTILIFVLLDIMNPDNQRIPLSVPAVEPKQVNSQTADPQTSNLQSPNLQTSNLQISNPQTNDPQASNPQASDPQTDDSQKIDTRSPATNTPTTSFVNFALHRGLSTVSDEEVLLYLGLKFRRAHFTVTKDGPDRKMSQAMSIPIPIPPGMQTSSRSLEWHRFLKREISFRLGEAKKALKDGTGPPGWWKRTRDLT